MIKINKYIDYGFYKTLLDFIENESLIYHFQNVIKVKHFFGKQNRIFKMTKCLKKRLTCRPKADALTNIALHFT